MYRALSGSLGLKMVVSLPVPGQEYCTWMWLGEARGDYRISRNRLECQPLVPSSSRTVQRLQLGWCGAQLEVQSTGLSLADSPPGDPGL